MSAPEPQINLKTYHWSARAFSIVRKWLKLNVKLHGPHARITDGCIFLFNHFARVETFIPQYLFLEEADVLCRSVASAELFGGDDAFTNYLIGLGAVPNDYPRLFPLLAAEILRGRKIIMFPEGGMVKDRKVLEDGREYRMYSRSTETRRKHHLGAAVLAVGLDAFKTTLRALPAQDYARRMESLAHELGMQSPEQLDQAVRKPTLIVPANITFYPLRVGDNLLRKGAELISRGLDRRASEELLIEGNILLKHTDMDIRLGAPIDPAQSTGRADQWLRVRAAREVSSLDDWYTSEAPTRSLLTRWAMRRLYDQAERTRDECMAAMYHEVTVNLSHLAAILVHHLFERQELKVDKHTFTRWLYFAIKRIQTEPRTHLHRGISNPEIYASLYDRQTPSLAQFLRGVGRAGLIEEHDSCFELTAKIADDQDLDAVRVENPLIVYANEAAPVAGVRRAVLGARRDLRTLAPASIGELRMDDLRREYRWDREYYRKPRYAELNALQKVTVTAEPFLLRANSGATGVLLVHGFLAGPGEMRGLGEKIHALGHTVLGLRIKGHGTSPWDLRDRSLEDWLDSVRSGYQVLREFCTRISIIGFSAGGGLALLLGAEQPAGLTGIAAVATPTRFVDKSMRYVPLVHGANKLLSWVPSFEGVKPFVDNASEHPHVNYAHMPVRALHELTRMVDALRKRAIEVMAPVMLIHATADPVVDPLSQDDLARSLGNATLSRRLVESDRHGLICDDIGDTHAILLEFLASIGDGSL